MIANGDVGIIPAYRVLVDNNPRYKQKDKNNKNNKEIKQNTSAAYVYIYIQNSKFTFFRVSGFRVRVWKSHRTYRSSG